MDGCEAHSYSWPDGTVVEADGTMVFRPSWENYRSKVLRVPGFLVVVAVINMRRLVDPVSVGLVVATVLLSVAGLMLYFRRAVTTVGPRGVLRRKILRTKIVPKERMGDVILATQLTHFDQRVDTTLIITDTGGKRMMMFNGPYWSAEQLSMMASVLQQPTWQPTGAVSFNDIRRRYPKAVPLSYARPFAFAWGLVFAFFGIIAAIVILILLLTG